MCDGNFNNILSQIFRRVC